MSNDFLANSGMSTHQHFGDLMKSTIPASLDLTPFSPLERIVLTANGNLQRILRFLQENLEVERWTRYFYRRILFIKCPSSYHNHPVHVNILKNILVVPGEFRRCVTLCMDKVPFCIAFSTIYVTSPLYLDSIGSNRCGIGQLFDYFRVLPEFHLFECHHSSNIIDSSNLPNLDGLESTYLSSVLSQWLLKGHFSRSYRLTADGLVCHITEYLRKDLFESFFCWILLSRIRLSSHVRF